MKHILIPIDFSEQSIQAAHCAFTMYQDSGVRFYIFYSEHTDTRDDGEATILENNVQERQTRLVQFKRKLATGQAIIPLLWKGGFIEDIRTAIFDNEIDLIVLSTQYPNIFCDGVQGSHTREIITRIKCPVLIVPRQSNCYIPKQIVLLSDFNFKHRSQATTVVSKFVQQANAHLSILQLSTTDNVLTETQSANKVYMQSALDAVPNSYHFVINKTMDEALQTFVDMHGVDLVILFAKNINISENLLFSPTLNEHNDYHKSIPFLVVHE